jgi:hypothetical protein
VPVSATDREAAVRAAFAEQAEWCDRLGSPLTAMLCRLLGERLDRKTELGRRVLDWPGDPRPSADGLALRLCGGLHALVRRGAAPALAVCYPPHPVPGPEALWDAIAPVTEGDALLPWLDSAPQTNEVGRSALLYAGLLAVAERFPQPMALFELGASAGLNLILDRYGYDYAGAARGETGSPLQLRPQCTGAPPPAADVKVARREGVDLHPMDPRADAERLIAYVWPDQAQRLAQLETALALAAAPPPRLDTGDAAAWTETRMFDAPEPGVTRVVLHSVAFQYFHPETQARVAAAIEAAGASAGEETPVAWLRYERLPEEADFTLRLRLWPDGEDRLLARGHAHGRWAEWLA